MKSLSTILSFSPFFMLAVAHPTEPRSMASEHTPVTLDSSPTNTLTRRIDLCSPKCKAELDSWQSCIYIPYCRDSREFNNRQTTYDNCCKVAGETKPQPENKPINEVIERINSILEYLGLNPVGKPANA